SAQDLSGVMIREFADREHGGFFYTGESHEALIARQKDVYDNATPSGSAMAATSLLRLGALTGPDHLTGFGRPALRAAHLVMDQAPTAAGQSLVALDFDLAPPREFAVITGTDPIEFASALRAIYSRFLPHKLVAPSPPGDPPPTDILPLLSDRR